MARITVEDCLKEGDSYFELAYTSARRAREILRHGNPQVPEKDDKAIVVALREVAHQLESTSMAAQMNIVVTEEAEQADTAEETAVEDTAADTTPV